MAKRWLTIGDVQRLIKQKLYQLETGSKAGDQLIFDRESKKYVGHIEQGNFYQHPAYVPTDYILKTLNKFDNTWNNTDNTGW